jgi:hypothetical protein
MIMRTLTAFAFAVLPTLASANIVTNGDFETAGGAGWTTTPVVGFADVSVYAAPNCCGAVGTYPSGPGAAFFGWGDTVGGTLSQDLTTVIGQKYVVSFDHGAFIGASIQSMLASIIGAGGASSPLASQIASSVGTPNLATVATTYSFMFTADSTLTKLLFADTSTVTNSVDGILDNVSVNAVPLPASLTLILAGIAMMVRSARKSKML